MQQPTNRLEAPVALGTAVASAPTPVPATEQRPARVWTAGFVGRLILTLGGAALMIVGTFLAWSGSISAVNLDDHAFYQEVFRTQGGFPRTVGIVIIAIALAGIVGLAVHAGWPVRAAAALGIVASTLVLIQVFRSSAHPTVGPGAWVAMAGALIMLVAGFLGTGTFERAPADLPR